MLRVLYSGFLALLLAAGVGAASPAWAGCGCDHPAPPWTVIAPPFASPGMAVRIYADGADFVVGASYQVDFGGSAVAHVNAEQPGYLSVVVPAQAGEAPGPKAIHVQGQGYDRQYADALFTALPPAPVIPASGGRFGISKYHAAVASDGAVLLPLDVTGVLDPMQLSVMALNRKLAFGSDDVVIYNADGVDLTLFTLTADDATERQWGSYFGWRVERDKGLRGDVFKHRVKRKLLVDNTSDVLSYWRHEFHTYAAAHDAGGTHSIDVDNRHPDGTLHIDHYRLVLALSALDRTGADDEADPGEPLDPGMLEMDLVIAVTPAEGPIEPDQFMQEIGIAATRFLLMPNKPVRQLITLP
jgi:hypothetical protein